MSGQETPVEILSPQTLTQRVRQATVTIKIHTPDPHTVSQPVTTSPSHYHLVVARGNLEDTEIQ